jgi:hypothetical protein
MNIKLGASQSRFRFSTEKGISCTCRESNFDSQIVAILNYLSFSYCLEEIKRRLNSGNACYHSVQCLLSSRLLSKNLKIRIYKMIILPVVQYGCETWSLTLREEHRLRV